MLLPAVRHEVSFWHGACRLDGDLVLPGGAGPHPVVVIATDSLTPDRDYSPLLDGLAAAGLAAFTWDRPPAPARSPDPLRRTADQAREVLSAVNRLRSVPQLDPAAVAVAGWGHGGLAAAQAATFSHRIRAVILAGAPLAHPARLVEHRVLAHLRERGHAGAEVDAARDAVRGWVAGLAAGLSGGELDDVLDAHRHEAWHGALRSAADITDLTPSALAANPLPTLSAVRVPVLALFGEQDPTLPLADCVRGVRGALAGAGHDDHRVAVVRGGDRALRVRPGHGLGSLVDGRHQFGDWPAGLTELVVRWLEARIRPVDEVPGFVPPIEPAGAAGPAGMGSAGTGSAGTGSAGALEAVGTPAGDGAVPPAVPVKDPPTRALPPALPSPQPFPHVPVRQVRRRISR